MGLGISEMLEELSATLKERISNPVVSAFTLSWLIVNYRLFVVIFSGQSPAMKFGYIDEVMYATAEQFVSKVILIPALVAAVYIFIVPKITKPIYRYILEDRKAVLAVRMASEGAQILTQEQAKKIKDLATEDEERISLLNSQAEAKLAEADVKVRKAEAEAENRAIDAQQKVDEANLKAGALARDLATVGRRLIVEQAATAVLLKSNAVASSLEELITKVEFDLVYKRGEIEVRPRTMFGRGNEISSELDDFTSWRLEKTKLVIDHRISERSIDLDFEPQSRSFRGYAFGDAIWARPRNI